MQNTAETSSRKYFLYLTLGALGVVFGDIGTSPLYAIRECFNPLHGLSPTPEHVLGVLSLIVWSLIIIVSLKYLNFVMLAENRGEGGVLALTALVYPRRLLAKNQNKPFLLFLGLIGAALLYGDGMITPAISVLSAVEGLNVATTFFEPYIIGITVVILTGLFFVQRYGTGSIGIVFGPVIFLWFATIGIFGLASIVYSPEVLVALNPMYAFRFSFEEGLHGFLVLGSVFLVVTGAEALYADMGHFGRKPINLGWFCVAFPGLLLNYFGQGALLLRDPSAITNPFYLLSPKWALYPLVGLATAATVIASQALISGAFSLTRQAVQLGFLPRLQINHTSSKEIGQIYIPPVNQLLWISTIMLVLGFRSSSNLAAAYGIAVSTTMVITTCLTYFVAIKIWRWGKLLTGSICAFFLFVDFMFFCANSMKLGQGAWVPIFIAGLVFTLMITWYRGRQILSERIMEQTMSLPDFFEEVKTKSIIRVPGLAIFMTRNFDRTPPALFHNVKHNKVMHHKVLLLIVNTEEIPYVAETDRVETEDLKDGFSRMTLHYGFMESPDVPEELKKHFGSDAPNTNDVTFFFGKETLIATERPGMAMWREKLFAFMARNSQRATAFYQIPPEQVIEIGLQVEL